MAPKNKNFSRFNRPLRDVIEGAAAEVDDETAGYINTPNGEIRVGNTDARVARLLNLTETVVRKGIVMANKASERRSSTSGGRMEGEPR